MLEQSWCPLCAEKGINSRLKSFQLNLNEAIQLCDNNKCDFPLRQSGSQNGYVFTRDFNTIPSVERKDNSSKVHLELQRKVAPHMKTGAHISVAGTQRGRSALKSGPGSVSSRSSSIVSGRITPDIKPHSSRSAASTTSMSLCSVSRQKNVSRPDPMSYNCTRSTQSSPMFPGLQLAGCGGNSKTMTLSSTVPKPISSAGLGILTNESICHNPDQQQVTNPLTHNLTGNRMQNKENSGVTFSDTKHKNRSEQSDMPDILYNKSTASDTLESVKSGQTNQNSVSLGSVSTLERKGNEENNKITKHSISDEDCTLGTYLGTCPSLSMGITILPDYPQEFLQWHNRDALCWLDVVLCLIVHNLTLRRALQQGCFRDNSVIHTLLTAHQQAQTIVHSYKNRKVTELPDMIKRSQSVNGKSAMELHGNQGRQKVRERSVMLVGPKESFAVKTGAGERQKWSSSCVGRDFGTTVGRKFPGGTMSDARGLLEEVREEVWNSVRSHLKCERGQQDSPVFTFPLLLQHNQIVTDMFKMKYRFKFSCGRCGHSENQYYEKVMPTLPNVVTDFNIEAPAHHRKCFNCNNTDSTRHLVYDSLPECLLMHFTDGLNNTCWEKLEFSFHGNLYRVTAAVQYVNNPDHFIAWLRDPEENRWMKCDDLGPQVCKFQTKSPTFSSKEVHIVMWERHVVPTATKKSSSSRLVLQQPESDTASLVDQVEPVTALKTDCVNNGEVTRSAVVSDSGPTVSVSASVKRKLEPLTLLPSCSVSRHVRVHSNSNSSVTSDSPLSVHLPEFISTTTASETLVKPIPCWSRCQTGEEATVIQTKCIVPLNTNNPQHSSSQLTSASTSQSFVQSLSSNFCEPSASVPKTTLSGPSTVIKPSSVFCVPHKSGVTPSTPSSVSSSHCPENRAGPAGRQETGQVNRQVNKTTVVQQITSNKEDKKVINRSKSGAPVERTQSSKLFSKFRLPVLKRTVSKLSQEAFPTLKMGRAPSTRTSDSSNSSCIISPAVSPALNQGPGYLSSVKRYLINRATCKTETPAMKFEGLNLKSAPYLKGDTTSLSGLSMCGDESQCSSERVMSPLSDCFGRKDTSSETNCDVVRDRKRKCVNTDSQSDVGGVKKSREVDTVDTSGSLGKENKVRNQGTDYCSTKSVSRTLRTRNPSVGKKMSLIRDYNEKIENADVVINKTTTDSVTDVADFHGNVAMSTNRDSEKCLPSPGKCFPSPRKCETEAASVLQDLYEALNIPYPSMQEMMSDVISDVDDLLDVVTTTDLHTTSYPLSSSPSACATGHSLTQTQDDITW